MLTRRELAEMRALVTRATKGSATREDWSNLAALTLVWQGDATVLGIAGGGYDAFKAVCEPIYENHHFRDDDFHRIYARVCTAATRHARDLVS